MFSFKNVKQIEIFLSGCPQFLKNNGGIFIPTFPSSLLCRIVTFSIPSEYTLKLLILQSQFLLLGQVGYPRVKALHEKSKMPFTCK